MEITRRTILTYAAALGLPEMLVGTATRGQTGAVRIRQTFKPSRCRAMWRPMTSSIA